MFLLNNVKVHQDIQRTIGDVQYPARWFSNAEARAKVGMIEVPDIPRPDDALFTSVENPDGSYTATPRTAADLASREEASTAAALEASKAIGVSILGVMCSATKADQAGLSAVAIGVTIARLAGQTFPDTRFEFENGNSLVVTDANFDAIYAAWTPFRQSFFRP